MGIIHSTAADFFKLDKKEFKNFFTTGFIMPVAVTFVSIILLFVFRQQLQRAYGFPSMFVWLIPIICFLTFCNEQFLGLARNNNEPNVYLKANISKTILELGISFVLVVFFAAHWKGRIQGILVSYVIVALYGFYYFRKKGYLFGSIEKIYIYSELIYALPIMAMQASIFSMSASDKFFVSSFSNDGNTTVGIYSIACVFASVINILQMALLQYIFPKIYTMLSSAVVDYTVMKKTFLVYLAIMGAGTIGIIIITPLLYHFFINPQYHSALRYIYLLCIGNFLWAISYFFYSFLLYHKQKKTILILSLCCIIISVACNYVFIKQWKDFGGALSTIVSYFIVFLITLFFTRSYWKKFLLKPHSTLQ